MGSMESIVAIFPTHAEAENAIKQLARAGFDLRSLSVVGRGYHIDEKVIGFYNMSDRVTFWGTHGAFWGGLWGLFTSGILITVQPIGGLVALGYVATTIASAIEGAVMVGAVSAMTAALFSLGIPNDSIIQYETALAADKFLIMAHGPAAEITLAKKVLGTIAPLDVGHFRSTDKQTLAA